MSSWTFLTNHAHVLLSLAAYPDLTLREVAARVGITERAAHRIVTELEAEGALERQRQGRRNHYEVRRDFPLRHQLERHNSVGRLIELLHPELDVDGLGDDELGDDRPGDDGLGDDGPGDDGLSVDSVGVDSATADGQDQGDAT